MMITNRCDKLVKRIILNRREFNQLEIDYKNVKSRLAKVTLKVLITERKLFIQQLESELGL